MYAVIFDLDDTLYPELSYVKSGFRAVARFLTSDPIARVDLTNQMLELFASDPRSVFQQLVESLAASGHGQVDSEQVFRLVQVYRTHTPDIQLYDDVLPAISALRNSNIKLGIITDGRADGQRAKLEALGLFEIVDVAVVTDSLGPNRHYWKPHTRPFEHALSTLGVLAENSVYVGDNPTKDFHGPFRLGMRTVQIRRPDALNLYAREGHEGEMEMWLSADHVIDNLAALLNLLEGWSWLD